MRISFPQEGQNTFGTLTLVLSPTTSCSSILFPLYCVKYIIAFAKGGDPAVESMMRRAYDMSAKSWGAPFGAEEIATGAGAIILELGECASPGIPAPP